ncbi:NAD-dependent epimerase/dehydratase family protein [Streptomyces sp. SBT349]|uniref:NAD-dependent epimerase/dehydratase family protein n=1 Tax=Streptomyces sp. SBT349 TaxID=1580539 RepID=UPI0007C6DE97|nr:NAD(P)-dependent oxidoreductase [Streptomyces sp. SBT349]
MNHPPNGDLPNRVLVTGASGHLGRETTLALTSLGVAVTGLDRELHEPDNARRFEPGWDRFVTASAGDPDAVAEALADADGVVHLAAIPAPTLGTPEEVFGGNSLATFTVLDAAGRRGVRQAELASSLSILGTAFSPEFQTPAYLPLDTATPLMVADPYALSKQADEATAAMATRRYGMTTTALRFPHLGYVDGNLGDTARRMDADPSGGARTLWSYLDLRDAARACVLALTRPGPGAHVLYLAAGTTLVRHPTEDLVRTYLPDARVHGALPGRTVPIDLTPAHDLLAFTTTYSVD